MMKIIAPIMMEVKIMGIANGRNMRFIKIGLLSRKLATLLKKSINAFWAAVAAATGATVAVKDFSSDVTLAASAVAYAPAPVVRCCTN